MIEDNLRTANDYLQPWFVLPSALILGVLIGAVIGLIIHLRRGGR